MEIRERAEMFVQEDGGLIFDHTKLILRRDEDYFYARIKQRINQSSTVDIGQLETYKISMESVWPPMESRFTQAPDIHAPDVYLKTPSLLDYSDTPASRDLGCQILTEVEACEALRQSPHPNIARYHGCAVKNGKITGICFTKYSMTLSERLKDATPLDKDRVLQGIQRGAEHMHRLGLIHNDLNPRNVMMDGDNPVIIDFDSCKREGDQMGIKGGTVGWSLDDVITTSKRENDMYSLSKLREHLTQASPSG